MNTVLVIQLDDGTSRVHQWNGIVSKTIACGELAAQKRSRLHTIVRATLFLATDAPETLDLNSEEAVS